MNKIKSIIQGLYGISESENMISKESARFTLSKTVECLELALKEHDKEIRAKVIDEFAERLKAESFSGYVTLEDYCEDTIESVAVEDIVRIAEQMKG